MITVAAIVSLVVLFGASLASAVVPFSPPEAMVLALSAAGSPSLGWALAVAVVAAAGQAVGKLLVVLFVRGSLRRPPRFINRLLPRRLMGKLADHIDKHPRHISGLVALSAFASIPPLAVVSPLVGTTTMRPRVFMLFCFAGRLARFSLLAVAPTAF